LALPFELVERIVEEAWLDLVPPFSQNPNEVNYYRCRFYIATISVSRAWQNVMRNVCYRDVTLRTEGDVVLYTELLKLHIKEWTAENTNIHVAHAALYRKCNVVLDLFRESPGARHPDTCPMFVTGPSLGPLAIFSTASSIIVRSWDLTAPMRLWLAYISPYTLILQFLSLGKWDPSQSRALGHGRLRVHSAQQRVSSLTRLAINLDGIKPAVLEHVACIFPVVEHVLLSPLRSLTPYARAMKLFKRLRTVELQISAQSNTIQYLSGWDVECLLSIGLNLREVIVSVPKDTLLEDCGQKALLREKYNINFYYKTSPHEDALSQLFMSLAM
jgi:hypothetical protein